MDFLKAIPFLIWDIFFDHFLKIKYNFRKSYPKYWDIGEKGNIVIIPGWTGSWIYFKKIGDYLNKKGYKIIVIEELQPNSKKIAICSEILEKELLKKNITDVILVGHSKGGIVAKYFLDNSKESSRVKRVITVSSPFYGSWFALVTHSNAYELLPSSKVIKNLTKETKNNGKIFNAYPKYDNYLIPHKPALLDGAINKRIDIVGHVGILFSGKLFSEIDNIT